MKKFVTNSAGDEDLVANAAVWTRVFCEVLAMLEKVLLRENECLRPIRDRGDDFCEVFHQQAEVMRDALKATGNLALSGLVQDLLDSSRN